MAILAYTDFVDLTYLDMTNTSDRNDVAKWSDHFEDMYCKKLMGQTLWTEFKLRGVTPANKWTNLINGLSSATFDYGGEKYILNGLKIMLKWFVYYHLILKKRTMATQAGQQSFEVNVSKASIDPMILVEAYNKGVEEYNICSYYMYANPTDYSGLSTETIETINIFGI